MTTEILLPGSWRELLVSKARHGLPLYILIPILLVAINLSVGLHRRISRARRARKLSCRPTPLEPSSLPLGIDTVLSSLRADREQRTPDHVAARFAALGAYTFRISLLGTTNLVTADPRNIQALLATQFSDFGMGLARSTNLKTVLGRSIFAADGATWRAAREMMRPLFNRDNVSRLDLLEAHIQTLFLCIEKDLNTTPDGRWSGAVSLASLFPFLTLDSATELFLGQSTSTLEARLRGDASHMGTAFNHAFERMLTILGIRMRLRSLYWLYGTKELQTCVATLHAFVDDAIAASDRARAQGASLAPYDFLDVLRERCAGGDEEVREQVLGLLAAGRDTTASLMGWAWYCLVRNPRVFAKIRAEVLATFGPGASPERPDAAAAVTFASLKQCAYLQHVLSETLRLHSVVPFNSRRALRDTTLPVGGGSDGESPVFVPADTEVNFSTHVLHRRPDLWGEDAGEFVPERWEKKRGAAGAAWHFVPFNGGPRICIGQQLALTEAGYVIVRMLQRYDAVEGLDVDPGRDWHDFTVVCSPGSPVDRHEAVLCRLRVARR
ncbi:cytochrome P450 [Colletotrichum graminicola]|uniref:Cytochrome P450 n=1 Tax=Colletotrichum graminicola (strain M1.001 / M2 / FGSC 10212) TaxID=645133 RepID=E3QWD7_COLGM|nr:cytochrome P450 [Colletotrichum graminicola M1.001]EFQ35175.1 cytochrome P450 [Colletotrichum graminicola M1.001]WDK10028.1 cytochrome P450 [Colletotrichum graminicola]